MNTVLFVPLPVETLNRTTQLQRQKQREKIAKNAFHTTIFQQCGGATVYSHKYRCFTYSHNYSQLGNKPGARHRDPVPLLYPEPI